MRRASRVSRSICILTRPGRDHHVVQAPPQFTEQRARDWAQQVDTGRPSPTHPPTHRRRQSLTDDRRQLTSWSGAGSRRSCDAAAERAIDWLTDCCCCCC